MFRIQEDSIVNLPGKSMKVAEERSHRDSTSTVSVSCVEKLWLQETVYTLLLRTDNHSILAVSWVGRTLQHKD